MSAQDHAKKLGAFLDVNIPKLFKAATGIAQVDVARENTDKTIQAQLEQQKFQNDYNYRMWQEQNAYNTPSAQMERLGAAGLNPNLVYGSGSVVGNAAEQAPRSATADLNYNYAALQLPQFLQVLNMYQDFRQKQANINQTDVITDKIIADTVLKATDKELKQGQLARLSAILPLEIANWKNRNQSLIEGNILKKYQASYAKWDAENAWNKGIPKNSSQLMRLLMGNDKWMDIMTTNLIQNLYHLFFRDKNKNPFINYKND